MTQESKIKYEKISPIYDRILIKVINNLDKDENNSLEQTKLRELATKKMLGQEIGEFETTIAMNNCGTVCCAGTDAKWVSDGDIVFFGKYAGSEMLIESEPHLMIRESDVLFILKK